MLADSKQQLKILIYQVYASKNCILKLLFISFLSIIIWIVYYIIEKIAQIKCKLRFKKLNLFKKILSEHAYLILASEYLKINWTFSLPIVSHAVIMPE